MINPNIKKYLKIFFLGNIIACILGYLLTSCSNKHIEEKDPSYEYLIYREGNKVSELKLKFNLTKTELLEAYYKPIEKKNYIPLKILSKNENPLFYLVNYTEHNQVIKLFTDFGAGASLFFSADKFITFNKEYWIEAEDKSSILITSGLPSFMPFFLTDPQKSYIHALIPSSSDIDTVETLTEHPNSIVFKGSFTNGKNAIITVFHDETQINHYTFIVNIEGNKITFKTSFPPFR